MTIKKWIGRNDSIRQVLKRPDSGEISDRLRIDPQQRSAFANQASGPLADLFFGHSGRVIHKWVHYLDIYERHFSPYRNTPFKMLEIGVSKGGSLEMWRQYFGDKATIFGIDINPACADRVTAPNQVRIGSQDDPEFLKKVVLEMGIPDIVLDDGSHIASHQQITFDVLFPLLKPGALYVIEDLHTSYWPAIYGGGHGRKKTAIGHVKQMIDDMHAWYHNSPEETPAKTEIGAIHMYDSIVFIEKVNKQQPGHLEVG
jgi:cephalosporin hydroxylase